MKGKGSRGIPGNRGRRQAAGGITKKAKDKFEKADFKKSEWTLVAEKGELGAETGSTKAVAAGQSPMGQEYIWTLVRGDPVIDGDDFPESTCYITDGSCRTCLFPLTNGKVEPEAGGYSLTCGCCGTKYSLDTGKVLDFLPGNGPVQFAAKLANRNKEPQDASVLKTRVSQTQRCYVRLPDGTLPITTRLVPGTINQREEIPTKQVQKKSKSKK